MLFEKIEKVSKFTLTDSILIKYPSNLLFNNVIPSAFASPLK